MGTIRVVDMMRRASNVLKDPTAVRWPLVERQDWLNDGYRAVIDQRPDAYSQTATFACAPGTRQSVATIGPSALRPLDVLRNLAAGSTRAAIRHVQRDSLDSIRPLWHDEPETLDIQFWSFDPRQPTAFFVYPPAMTGAQVEVVYSALPTPHTLTEGQLASSSTTETIRLSDGYANVLLDYMLYRAYSKDAEDTAMANRAAATYQAFLSALQVQSTVDGATAQAVNT